MLYLMYLIQVIVAIGLLNVWLLRFNQPTSYRGGNAKTMPQEFAAYGLPPWMTYVVGGLKIAVAICFIAGIWLHLLVLPAAIVLALLMLGALAMHVKIHDPLVKSLPAIILLLLSAGLCYGSNHFRG